MKVRIPQKKTPAMPQIERLAYSQMEVALMLGVSVRTIQVWAKAGKIVSKRVGGRTLIPVDSVKTLLQAESK